MPDQNLTCSDCGEPFVFNEEEQAFFAEKGLRNTPKRCAECRKKRRSSNGVKVQCVGCDKDFVFSEEEQAYFREMGLTNPPKRCRNCRNERRKSGEKAAFDARIQTREFERVWDEEPKPERS